MPHEASRRTSKEGGTGVSPVLLPMSGLRTTQGDSLRLTAAIHREGCLYVAECVEFDIASQGTTLEEAGQNLHEAIELFLECASPTEIDLRVPRAQFTGETPVPPSFEEFETT